MKSRSRTNMLAERRRLAANAGLIGVAVRNGAMIKDSRASGNAVGFYTSNRSHVSACIAFTNIRAGFNCPSYVTRIECTSSRAAGAGIVTQGSCNVVRCSATRNTIIGVNAGPGCTVADFTPGGIIAPPESWADFES